MPTYSFLDVQAALTDDAGNFSLGSGAGVADEGITIAMEGDKTSIQVGADGTPQTSLHAAQNGTVSVRIQKTSPVNHLLSQFYDATTISAANVGQATITISNLPRGDSIVCHFCSVKKFPDNVNAKEAGMNDWVFIAGVIRQILGDGAPTSTTILA